MSAESKRCPIPLNAHTHTHTRSRTHCFMILCNPSLIVISLHSPGQSNQFQSKSFDPFIGLSDSSIWVCLDSLPDLIQILLLEGYAEINNNKQNKTTKKMETLYFYLDLSDRALPQRVAFIYIH